ncbi:MAG: diacylglycerol kinase family lipid kinase [Sandaracinus sp.]|nr:diacylglycerol kinase family lipid kinase [Sandaracinus sp.]MCB9616930.1 diacylglycerol kinase family lipid kinase [Sandaracinus sp.]
MSQPFVAIVNGAAGGGRCRKRAADALALLRARGVAIEEPRFTEAAGHATELVREAWAKGHRRFLGVGGDGTSYELVNGLFPIASDAGEVPTLASLPLGTGNSFLRDFGIQDAEAAMNAIAKARPRRVDVIRVHHADGVLHYLNLLGLGFTATAGDLTNKRFKRFGVAGYVAAVLTTVVTLEHPLDVIRIDDDPHPDGRPAAFLSFSNSQFTGGAMRMAPDADPSDGFVDVIRAGAIGRADLVATFPKIFRGAHVEHRLVETRRARRVEFLEPRPQPCMIDGEIVPLTLRSLEVLPGVLEVMA